MPRIRTIKPEIIDDEKLGTVHVGARWLFVSMIVLADDRGNLRGSPSYIRSRAFVYDDDIAVSDVEGWLQQLRSIGLVTLYSVHGERFAALTGWSKHQVVNHPAKTYPIPAPDAPDAIQEPSGDSQETLKRPSGDSQEDRKRPSGGSLPPRARDLGPRTLDLGPPLTSSNEDGRATMQRMGPPSPAAPRKTPKLTYLQAIRGKEQQATDALREPTPLAILQAHPWTAATISDPAAWVARQEAASPDGYDIRAELIRALVWVADNAGRSGGKRDAGRYLAGWLNRSRERGQRQGSGSTAGGQRPADCPEWIDWDAPYNQHVPNRNKVGFRKSDGFWLDWNARMVHPPEGYGPDGEEL